MKRKAEPERADFVRLDVNDFGKQRFHAIERSLHQHATTLSVFSKWPALLPRARASDRHATSIVDLAEVI